MSGLNPMLRLFEKQSSMKSPHESHDERRKHSATAIFVLCAVVALCVLTGAEPPVPALEIVEEQSVPQSTINADSLQGRIPVLLEEYQRLKRLAESSLTAPSVTRLERAEYSATYAGHRLTEGRLTWTVQRAEPAAGSWIVHPLGLALRDLRWGDQPALWGMTALRQLEVVIDRPQGQLRGTWELVGETIVRHDEFQFRIPPATVSLFQLRVPAGFQVVVPGQIVPHAAAPEAGWNVWNISLGNQAECRISIHPPLPPGVAASMIQVRSQTAYGIRQEGLRYFCELNLEVIQSPVRELRLSVDSELEIYSVNYGDIALPWKTGVEMGRQRLVITLPDPLLGASRPLRLQGVAPIQTDTPWTLPQLAVEGGVLEEGQAVLRIAPPLQLKHLQTDGYLQNSIENTTLRDDLTLKQFRQDGTIRVTLGKPRPRIQAYVLSDLQTRSSDWTCLTQLNLLATEGAAFEFTCRIPIGWDVTDVRDVNSPKMEWSIVVPAPGERLLALRFQEALSADKPRTIEIEARRGSGSADQMFAVPAFEPLGVDRLQMLVAVNSAAEVKPVLEAASTFEPCTIEELDSNWPLSTAWKTKFAERNPKPLLLQLNGPAPEGQITLQSLQTPVEVAAEMKIQFALDKMTKTVILQVSPQRGRTERVLVYQSEPGPQLTWLLTGTPARPVEARKLPTIRHAAWDLPLTGELWELRLPQPQSTPFTLEGIRTRGLPPTGRLGLVFVPQAQTFRGKVSVEAPAELGLELTADKTEADGVAESVPGPVKRSWSFHESGAALKFQVRVAATQAPEPVIRRVALEARWTLQPTGYDYYLTKLELGSGFRGSELRVLFPNPAEIIEIRIDRQPIPFQAPEAGTPLVLSNITDEQIVAITYRSPSYGTTGPVSRRVLLPQLSIPVLRFDLELMTPAGYRLGGEPSGMVLKASSGSISSLQRVFGPLGRPSSDSWFNPLSSRQWTELFASTQAQDEAAEDAHILANQEGVHPGWEVFRGSAALLPEQIEVWLWSNRQAQDAAWLGFWGCVLVGATIRLTRLPTRGLVGLTALVIEIFLAFTLPSVPAQIAGACLTGTLLATLWPRSLIARVAPPVTPGNNIPQDSTQSYRVAPKPTSSQSLTAWGFTAAVSIGSLSLGGACLAQTPVPNGTTNGRVNGQLPSSSPVYRVLIPSTADGKPIGGQSWAYVPDRLLKLWSERYSQQPQMPAWLIQSGEYSLRRDSAGQVTIAALFDVAVLSTANDVEVGFPLTGINFGGSAACRVDGQPQPVLTRGDGRVLFLRLPGAERELKPAAPPMPEPANSTGAPQDPAQSQPAWPMPVRRFRVEFLGYPILRSVVDGTWMEFSFPKLNSNRLIVRNEQVDTPWTIQFHGTRHSIAFNQPLSLEVGPISQLRIETTPNIAAEDTVPKIEARLAALADVKPASTRMSYQVKYTITSGRITSVAWLLPPRLVVRQVVGPEVFDWRVEGTKDGGSRLQIDLRPPVAEGFFVRVDVILPNEGPATQATLPAVQLLAPNDTPFRPQVSLIGVRSPSEFLVEAPVDAGEQIAPATVEDFLKEWNDVDLKPQLVYSLLDPASLKIGLKLLAPQRVVRRMTSIGVLGSRQLQWNLNATIEVQNAAAFSHQLEVDPRLVITNVSIQEDAANRLLRWTRSGNLLQVYLRDKTTGTQTLSLQGTMPTQIPQEELALPTIKVIDATLTDAQLQLYQEPDLEVEVSTATQWERLEAPSEVRTGALRSNLIVGRFKWPGDASPFVVRIAQNEPVLNYSAVTTLQPRDGHWKLRTSLLFQVEKGHGSQFSIRVPPEVPHPLVDAGDVRLLLEKESDGSQRIALIPQTPVRGRFVVQLSGDVNMPTTGQTTIPEILGLNATKKDHFIVLPEERLLTVDSRTSGLVAAPLPPHLATLVPADLQAKDVREFRGDGNTWTVSIPRLLEETPQAGVLWTETQIWCSPVKNLAGRTTTVVGPQELENLELTIPEGISLQGVLLDGEFIPHTRLTGQSLKIPLTFPQAGHVITLQWTQETPAFEGWWTRTDLSWPRVIGHSVSEQYVTLTPPTGFRARTNAGQSVERMTVQLGELTVLLQLMQQRAADGPAPQDVLWTFLQQRAAGLIKRLQGESRVQTRSTEFAERFALLQSQFAPWAPLTTSEVRSVEDFHSEGDVLRPFASLDGNLAGPHSLLIKFRSGAPQASFAVSMIHESFRSWGVALLIGIGVLCFIWPLLRWKFPEWLAQHPAIAWALFGIVWWTCLRPSILGLVCLTIAAVIAMKRFPRPKTVEPVEA